MRKLELIIDRLIQPMSYKFGIMETKLRVNWPRIMPVSLARYSNPTKIIYNKFDRKSTLYIKVSNGSVALEIQYLIPTLLEKIAVIFGYKIIHAIKIKQEIKFE